MSSEEKTAKSVPVDLEGGGKKEGKKSEII